MILIVSFPDNEHVEQVRRHLRAEHVVVDLADFPERVSLVARAGAGGERLALRLPDGGMLDLDAVHAVWFRRIRPFRLAPQLSPVAARFAWSECHEALEGVWHCLPAYWMNPPLADQAAQRKILQLRVAARVGLAAPDTLVTNDPVEAETFLDRIRPDRVIRKAFRNIEDAPRVTALVDDDARPLLGLVRHAPVIFQRFVPAVADLRVIAVGDELFAAMITSDAQHQVDYRPGLGTADVCAHRLPDEVAAGLRALMAELDLAYGAIDLRLTPDGEYVFLEVNPAGEYLFVSSRTGQPIPQAIADTLTCGGLSRSRFR